MKRKTILYLPDFESLYVDEAKKLLIDCFPECLIVVVNIDINDNKETNRNITQAVHLYHPDLLVAEGLGCYFIHQFGGQDRICVNPDLRPSQRCESSLVKMYAEEENEGVTYDRNSDRAHHTHCWGIFGTANEKRLFYMLHYPCIRCVPRKVKSILDVKDELITLAKDITESQWTDEYGVRYAEYGRVIVKADYAQFRDVKHYIIPSGVRYIQYGAFSGMNLVSISIPDSVTCIGHHAFSENKLLEEVLLPPMLDTIDMCTFENCVSLKKVILPRMLFRIDSDAFRNTALHEIELPHGIQFIEYGAFDESVKVNISFSHMREMLDDLWCNRRKQLNEEYEEIINENYDEE